MPAAGCRCGCRPAAVEVLDGPRVVARHERAAGKYAEILVLDHYLEVLRRKPGALPGATALAQARAAGTFTAAHQAVLGRRPPPARRRGRDPGADRGAARAPHPARRGREAAMTRAIASGVLDPQVVLIDARRQAGRQVAPVIPIGALARYDRPAPALDAYDQLLTRTIP